MRSEERERAGLRFDVSRPLRAILLLPDIFLAVVFLLALRGLDLFGGSTEIYLVVVFFLEFWVIHSAAILGTILGNPRMRRRKQFIVVAGISCLYLAVVAAIAYPFEVSWPIWAFAGLTANRLANVIAQNDYGPRREYNERNWLAGMILMVISVLLGVINAAGDSWHYEDFYPSFIAAGLIYFTAFSASELVDHRWVEEVYNPGWSRSGDDHEEGGE